MTSQGVRLEKLEIMLSGLPDKLDGKFVSHDVYDLRMKELDKQILELDLKIAKVSKNKTLQMWLLGTGSAVASALLVILIQKAIQ